MLRRPPSSGSASNPHRPQTSLHEPSARAARILAFLTAPEPVQAVLRHLGLPTTPPPLSPARGPPRPDLGFDRELDQTPPFDPAEPEPVPDFDDVHPDGGA